MTRDILPPPTFQSLAESDRKIIYELDKDGFESLSRIGKKLKISRELMHYRVKRLEEQGIIKKYIAIIDYSKLGYSMGSLYIKLQNDTPKIKNEILNYYKKQNNVWWLLEMSPNFDFSIAWFGKDFTDVKNQERELIKKYKKYFRIFKSRIYTSFHHFTRSYLTGGEKRKEILIKTNPKRITDKIDEKILKILSENARKPYTEIANELKLSAAQVHYKIQKLKEKKILLGARPSIDLEKIGLKLFKFDIYLEDYSIYEKLKKFLFELDNVIYAYDVIGGADIELDIEIKNQDEFLKLLDYIKSKFGEAISYSEYYQFTKEHKLKYFPNLK